MRTVIQQGEEPQPVEVLESAIIDLAKGMKKLTSSRLKEDTIVTLVSRSSGVARRDVEVILKCLGDLETLYLKKK